MRAWILAALDEQLDDVVKLGPSVLGVVDVFVALS
jgi:hypothetical protein